LYVSVFGFLVHELLSHGKNRNMLRNYFKTALRNLLRNKAHTLIIILGLAIGLAAVFIIALFLKHELSYDRFFDDSEKIRRVIVISERDGRKMPYTFEDMASLVEESFAEVAAGTKFPAQGYDEVFYGEENFGNAKLLYGDSSFFDVFSLRLEQGAGPSVLATKGRVILTRGYKQKIFGGDNAIGQTIHLGKDEYVVDGIMQDVPGNCHFQFDILVSFPSMDPFIRQSNNVDYANFLRFDQVPGPELTQKVTSYISGIINKRFEKYGIELKVELQPLEKIHFSSDLSKDYAVTGDKKQIYIFAVVALFILIIAVFNFLNLFTAQSEGRLKEVGIRKVIGSRRKQIIRQFIGESALIGLCSFLIAMLLVEVFIPGFFSLLRIPYDFSYTSEWLLILIFLIFTLIVGVISAWYPALYVSGYNPVRIFKGGTSGGRSGNPFRTVLVVLQFTLSIALLTSIVTLYSQVQYLKNKDVGFDRENLIYFSAYTSLVRDNYESIREELLKNPRIRSVTASMATPPAGRSGMSLRLPHQHPSEAFSCEENRVQPGYVETYGLTLLKGKDFTAPHQLEDIIINETAARMLGLENPLGNEVILFKRRCRIIGVVQDYNYRSLHRPIGPLVLSNRYDLNYAVSVRTNGEFDENTRSYVEHVCQQFDPEFTLKYWYIDDLFARQYGKEERLNTLILIASVLGILLSVIGLYAFVSLMLNKKIKEMGIRKTFGASSSKIGLQVAQTLLVWLGISAVLGWSLAWFFSSGWLQQFPYRIDLAWWIFAVSLMAVALLAGVAVFGKILRISRVNPAHILRYE
jgi:putative ABC transport system permease protein